MGSVRDACLEGDGEGVRKVLSVMDPALPCRFRPAGLPLAEPVIDDMDARF